MERETCRHPNCYTVLTEFFQPVGSECGLIRPVEPQEKDPEEVRDTLERGRG